MVRIRFRHGQKNIPLARRQHAIEAEHSAPEGNGSSRSVRLGVPRRRDKRGRRRTVARAIPRSLSLTKYTISEGRGRPLSAAPPSWLAPEARESPRSAAPDNVRERATPGSAREGFADWRSPD